MGKRWAGIGALFMAFGVVAGAFGAHGLRRIVAPEMLVTYEKGVHYQLVHGIAIMLAGLLCITASLPEKSCKLVNNLFAIGILLFSGSLYLLVLTGERWLGMVTPFGGVSFIVAWIILGKNLLARSN